MFKCFVVVGTEQMKEHKLSGPLGDVIVEVMYKREDTGQLRWDKPWAPGASFGQGALVLCYGQLHLVIREGWYINLEANGRQLRGIPPMVTVIHKTPSVWTLENGEFESDQCGLESFLRGTL